MFRIAYIASVLILMPSISYARGNNSTIYSFLTIIILLLIFIIRISISKKIESKVSKRVKYLYDTEITQTKKLLEHEFHKKHSDLEQKMYEYKCELEYELKCNKNDLEIKYNKKYYEMIEFLNNKKSKLIDAYKIHISNLKEKYNDVKIQDKLIKERMIGFPHVAEAYSLFVEKKFDTFEKYFWSKANPSKKSEDIVRDLKKEVKEYARQYFMYKGLVEYYETLIPGLEESKQIPVSNIQTDDSIDIIDSFLDPKERSILSREEKFQKALDRYWRRKKTKWEIGRDYERYIGYIYEQNNWDVTFYGAIEGLEDMGRDLICKKNGKIHIVQCKCWASDKVIHEKHIFQLFGTCIVYQIDNNVKVVPVFITSASVSDKAKECAKFLNVQIRENKRFRNFPSIKCNISRNGEKIYHLPFDQQYDKTKITIDKNECYCATIDEAEKYGFRRAYRWHGQNVVTQPHN